MTDYIRYTTFGHIPVVISSTRHYGKGRYSRAVHRARRKAGLATSRPRHSAKQRRWKCVPDLSPSHCYWQA